MKLISKTHLNIETLKTNVKYPAEIWLKPSEVSTLIGLDVKWLAAAREGLKGLEGPPYIKVGNGKTSPIRYPLAGLIKWMDSFPLQYSITNNHNSFISFISKGSLNDLWPCVVYSDGTMVELFISINSQKFKKHYIDRKIIWLSKMHIPNVLLVEKVIN